MVRSRSRLTPTPSTLMFLCMNWAMSGSQHLQASSCSSSPALLSSKTLFCPLGAWSPLDWNEVVGKATEDDFSAKPGLDGSRHLNTNIYITEIFHCPGLLWKRNKFQSSLNTVSHLIPIFHPEHKNMFLLLFSTAAALVVVSVWGVSPSPLRPSRFFCSENSHIINRLCAKAV